MCRPSEITGKLDCVLLWGLPILIPWIGILFLILYLIMRDSGRRIAAIAAESSAPARTTAEEVLDERYAKGGHYLEI